MTPLRHYGQIWCVDFEFGALPGERPAPLCLVARELRTGRLVREWIADGAPTAPPYPADSSTLIVAYYSSAEWGCHLALDWPLPVRILDLFPEFRNLTNGLPVPCGNGLLGALAYFGLDAIDTADKESMRQLALRGGVYTDAEQVALLDDCQSDVDALAKLLPAMLPKIDLPRALLRGRYMAAAARMEWNGTPIDTETFNVLRENWIAIKARLVYEVDRDYSVYVPTDSRPLDPDSRLGAAILAEAREWDIDPDRLRDAVEYTWQQERDSFADSREAKRAARKSTGLTPRRIAEIENAGHDHTAVNRLDTTARTLAGQYPALGIGRGYSSDAGEDGTEYAGALWEVLRDGDEATKPRHHPDIVRRAAELIWQAGPDADAYRPMRFSSLRFADYLARTGIPWPRLDSGALALDDETFREMAKLYPAEIGPLRELRYTLSQLRLNELAVGRDGRNRVLLSVFSARTSRNQPSNSRFIFGPSCWLRSLIKPALGRAVAYVDWEQQEFAIAAALSGDAAMMAAYQSGDPYLAFAKQAGAVPMDATKTSHGTAREQFKVCAVAVQYGMAADSLARRLSVPPCRGRELLALHKQTYPRFWEWSDRAEMRGMLHGTLQTVFGWTIRAGADVNPRSLRNFPVQANGAEMMRLAASIATERGIQVCAPVHDAFLIEADADEIDAETARMQVAMREASEIVLPGFPLRTDAKIVRWPDRYTDPRGKRLWEKICALLDSLADKASRYTSDPTPGTPVHPPPSLMSLSLIGTP